MTKKFDGRLLLFAGMIYLLAFQNALEGVWDPFSYLDEGVALLGILWVIWEAVTKRNFDYPKYLFAVTACLAVFSVIGLLGNVLYRYQPWKAVIIDLYTNLKFFLAILTGYVLFRDLDWETLKRQGNLHARIITLFLFAVFLLDRVCNFWPGSIRYGFKTAKLFFYHPTYLAGAAAFLLVLLTAFYEKKNLPFIAMGLTLLVFTLRSKAFASAAVLVGMLVYFVILKKKIKLWHVLIAAIGCVIIAWPQIDYYFIELSGNSARSVLLATSFLIMKDYFPIGTGFGTYASSAAEKWYSPVYIKYGFNDNMQLRDINNLENTKRLIGIYGEKFNTPKHLNGVFLNDSFWPIIFGQVGVLGTAVYISVLGILLKKTWELQNKYIYAFAAVLYAWMHLMICSMAEPAFNNPTAIPLALVLGIALCAADQRKFPDDKKDSL